jgi:hypothetical protein
LGITKEMRLLEAASLSPVTEIHYD